MEKAIFLLINVKMPTIVGIFNIYELEKFHAQLSLAWKKFYNLGALFRFYLPGPEVRKPFSCSTQVSMKF